MGGDHHHHKPTVKIPDWRLYKVADVPELANVEKALARRGLKNPWLRNDVWRYDPKIFGTMRGRWYNLLFRGLPVGIALCAATIAIEKVFDIDWHDPRGLHKGEHGHGGHH
jgi:NADH dehydrogenase (ubiquinone) 1 beta subcomplex subunit 3